MNQDLSDYRKSYEYSALTLGKSATDPFKQFKSWFEEVEQAPGVQEVNAMTLSTQGLDGFPKSRVVLLKGYDSRGFVFYTNYTSEKGKALAQYPKVCLSFFWPNLERQVIIKGEAARIPEEESAAYFQTRPHGSQLGAWVSPQSEVIPNREFLESRKKDFEREFQEEDIPKPPHWGGYRVRPVSFEFWQGRPNRLHDRLLYTPLENEWVRKRLAP